MTGTLSIRVDAENLDHHLWNNHGTWWCHYTVHPTAWTQRRVRRSLRTRDLGEARARRDALFARLASEERDARSASARSTPSTQPAQEVA